MEVNGYDYERTQNIQSNDTVGLPKLEIADNYALPKRAAPLLHIRLTDGECHWDARRRATSARHVDGDQGLHLG